MGRGHGGVLGDTQDLLKKEGRNSEKGLSAEGNREKVH